MKTISFASLVFAVVVGCGEDKSGNTNEAPPPEFGICGGSIGALSNPTTASEATTAQIAATPRAQPEMEALALSMTGGFIADQGFYERVVDDIAAIRSGSPYADGIYYSQSDDGKSVMLHVDIDTLHEMQAGSYTAWDTLNDRYGAVGIEYVELSSLSQGLVLIETKGIYDIELLSAEYAHLPNVPQAGPNGFFGDGNDICGVKDDQTFHYLFDRGSGDCIAGCMYHHFYYFKCDADQKARLVGEWEKGMTPEPDWLQQFLAECD